MSRPYRRRSAAIIAGVICLGAGTGVAAAGPVRFEEIGRSGQPSGVFEPDLLVAQSPAELEALWARLQLEGSPPAMDFDARLVVGFNTRNSGCDSYQLAGVTSVERQVVIAAMTAPPPPDLACPGVVILRNLALALDRSSLPEGLISLHYEVDGERVATTDGDFGGRGGVLPRTGGAGATTAGLLVALFALILLRRDGLRRPG